MYIKVKQLSNPMPTKNRQIVNCQKLVENAVSVPKTKLTRLEPMRAGMRPKWSDTQPNTRPPTMAPRKKVTCAEAVNVL